LVGALVMAHSDDQGLILPPKIAPLQVVIVPIYKGDEQKALIDKKAKEIMDNLKNLGVRVKYDDNDNNRPGWKFAEYELKGVPVRLALGARDLEKNVVEVARRDTKEKKVVGLDGIAQYVDGLLLDIQHNMFKKAKAYQEEHVTPANDWSEFEKLLDEKGGFISAHWDGSAETEEAIKEKTKATIRCIPLNNPPEDGQCIFSGKPSVQRVLFARAY
jgi:prolyl-tRNA synthetase